MPDSSLTDRTSRFIGMECTCHSRQVSPRIVYNDIADRPADTRHDPG